MQDLAGFSLVNLNWGPCPQKRMSSRFISLLSSAAFKKPGPFADFEKVKGKVLPKSWTYSLLRTILYKGYVFRFKKVTSCGIVVHSCFGFSLGTSFVCSRQVFWGLRSQTSSGISTNAVISLSWHSSGLLGIHSIILQYWNIEKRALSNFAFQYC